VRAALMKVVNRAFIYVPGHACMPVTKFEISLDFGDSRPS